MNKGPDIQDTVTMTSAKSTVTTYGHNIKSMTHVNEGWTLADGNKKITNHITYPLMVKVVVLKIVVL